MGLPHQTTGASFFKCNAAAKVAVSGTQIGTSALASQNAVALFMPLLDRPEGLQLLCVRPLCRRVSSKTLLGLSEHSEASACPPRQAATPAHPNLQRRKEPASRPADSGPG